MVLSPFSRCRARMVLVFQDPFKVILFSSVQFILFTYRDQKDVMTDAPDFRTSSYLNNGGNPRSLFTEPEGKIRVPVAQGDRAQCQTQSGFVNESGSFSGGPC